CGNIGERQAIPDPAGRPGNGRPKCPSSAERRSAHIWRWPSWSCSFRPFFAGSLQLSLNFAATTANHLDEVPQFLVHLFRAGNSLADFFSHQFAITGAQTMDRDFDRSLAHVQPTANLRISEICPVSAEEGLQRLQESRAVGGGEFLAQPSQGLLNESQRPAPFIQVFGGQSRERLHLITLLCAALIQ